jgi:hypothetical protein
MDDLITINQEQYMFKTRITEMLGIPLVTPLLRCNASAGRSAPDCLVLKPMF